MEQRDICGKKTQQYLAFNSYFRRFIQGVHLRAFSLLA